MPNWFVVLSAIFLFSSSSMAETESIQGGVVRKIEIQGNRVRESVIRKELTFTEGDRISETAIRESKENLYKLGLFKSLEIETERDETLDGLKVTIKANDGWYMLPLPILGIRGGDTYAALMVTEKNLFKWGEGITLWGSYYQDGWSGMGSVYLPKIYFLGGVIRSDRTEYLYKDGAYNSKTFDNDWEKEKPGDFGEIADSYRKTVDQIYLGIGTPPLRDWRLSLLFNSSEVSYGTRLSPPENDKGRQNSVAITVGYGKPVRMMGGYVSGMGGFGRIFGLGMAGVEESLKPLPEPERTWSFWLTVERGDELIGSATNFTKLKAQTKHSTLFRNRSYLEVAVNGGYGFDLPESQWFATNWINGLKGIYAREYRGEKIALATAEYDYPLFKNSVGGLIGKGYLDYAHIWQKDQHWERQGAGLELAYRFWRFPLPLRIGGTYSFDDRNW